jgi:hypothetical protein
MFLTNGIKEVNVTLDDLELAQGDAEPGVDIIRCDACGKTFKLEDCPTIPEGDFESGFFDLHECPECVDGGEPDYARSEERWAEWQEWDKAQEERKKLE